MEGVGINFSASGSLMSKTQLEEQRRKRGECLSCGHKCFQKKLFKMVPMTEHGKVLNGRCLKCKPLKVSSEQEVLPAVSRPATRVDVERFARSQSNLTGPGVRPAINRSGSVSSSGTDGNIETVSYHSGVAMGIDQSQDGDASLGSSRRSGRRQQQQQRSPRPSPGRRSPRPTPGNSRIMSSSRSMDSGISGSTQGGRSAVSAPYQIQSSGPPAPPLTSPPYGLEGALLEGDESGLSREDADFHSVVLGQAAAQQLATNFRASRSRPAQTPPAHEIVPDYYDDGQESSLEGYGPQRTSIASMDSRSYETIPSKQGMDDDDYEQHAAPIHGVLNRGGVVEFDSRGGGLNIDLSGQLPFSAMRAESNRTMSSMGSSIEEDGSFSNGQQRSWRRAAALAKHQQRSATAVYEEDATTSGTSGTSSAMRESYRSHDSRQTGRKGSVNRIVLQQEDQAMSRLDAAGNDYIEIVDVMRSLPSSTMIQQEAMRVLSDIHLAENDYEGLAAIHAPEAIVVAMRTHPHETQVQICGCRAIWNLSATTQSQIDLVQAHVLDVIMTAMEGFPEDTEVQEKAMAALSNLGAAEANHASLLEHGVVDRLVDSMKHHSEDSDIQVKACSAITNFASYHSPLKRRIMETGGGEAVVIAMIMHPEDVELQEKALRALRNICANSDENKTEVANVGGIDAVISSMQVHRDEPGVQEAGAWTLSNLAVNQDNKVIIGDSGGIDVIIRAIWVHSEHAGVQEWCCRALWTLSVDSQNRQVMIEVGAISAVINSMQAHADAATVQEKGCGVLSNLAATDNDTKERIVDEEGLDAIVMAMVIHSDNMAVQDRACSVLKRLAIGSNIKAMQAANVNELLRVASERFPDRCGDKSRYVMALL